MKTSLIVACALVASLLGPLANAGEDAQLLEARKVATMLPPRLLAALQEEIGRSGPAGAIPVCKDMAPKMAGEMLLQSRLQQSSRLSRMVSSPS